MNCKEVIGLLPGYLDGALPSENGAGTHVRMGQHLESCRNCREELQRYARLSSWMSRVERATPPADLALRIKVAASQRLSDRAWLHYLRLARTRVQPTLRNVLEPLALPATGGLTVALVTFAVVMHLLGMGMPLRAVTNDAPTHLLQPARLEALAPFSITGLETLGHSGPHALLVQATVNAEGQAVSYEILSGPDDPTVRRQLDQVLLFSRFRPQMSFGRPRSGGKVVLSFSDLRITG